MLNLELNFTIILSSAAQSWPACVDAGSLPDTRAGWTIQHQRPFHWYHCRHTNNGPSTGITADTQTTALPLVSLSTQKQQSIHWYHCRHTKPMDACMYACIHGYMHLCMPPWMHACMYACIHACCMHPWVHACMYACRLLAHRSQPSSAIRRHKYCNISEQLK